MSSTKPFKILSIDGGGIKGAFVASLLTDLEKQYCRSGKNVASYFDLIVGTSTGGILALGLGLGMPAADILNFYQKYGPQIFPQTNNCVKKFLKCLHNKVRVKYDRTPLETALKHVFQDMKLGNAITRLVIPSFDLQTGEVHLHKTAHHERLQHDYNEYAYAVALATSAAPTYFPTYFLRNIPLLDGGIWANDPALVAITEAQTLLGQDVKNISMLSLGCTQEPLNISFSTESEIDWALRISDLFTRAQMSAASGSAQLLLSERYIRISPTVPNGKFTLDGSQCINELVALGETEARKASPKVKQFFETKIEPFKPFYRIEEKQC